MAKKIALVSSCLLGLPTRYDGKALFHKKVLALKEEYLLIPVCPEQLGGLSTPREPAEIRDGKVFDCNGKDVTDFFLKGAEAVIKIADLLQPDLVIFKERSPSCGVNQICDGSFSGKKIPGEGITTQFLRGRFPIISEEEL